ncbi:MAG TPA: T9SS type A sorting domain-containing protein [Bacteroidia bacterium]|jgi:hypothetical protein|nr:T9SS type A sorting domain-containing protein [Bacteroidia bacterium]
MKKIYLLFFVLLCLGIQISSAQFNQWEKTIGGTNSDEGFAVSPTADGGYAITGTTLSFGQGGYDVYVVKLNSIGNLQWTKTIGGTVNEFGWSIIQTKDKGYIVTGYTNSFGVGNNDVYVIRLDSIGTLLWTKTIGNNEDDFGRSIIQSKDGGFLIAGTVNNGVSDNAYIIKLDSSGSLLWNKDIGTLDNDLYSIVGTKDGGYIVAGYTAEFGYYPSHENLYIIKFDSNDNAKWSKTSGGTGGYDGAYSIIQSSDGGYVAAGYTDSYGQGGYDVYVVKFDSLGNYLWNRTIGGTGTDVGYSLVQANDGGFLITGYTNSYGAGGYDVYLIKLTAAGSLLWTKTIGGSGNDYGYSICKSSDRGYLIVGNTTSYGFGAYDIFTIKLDSLENACSVNGSGGVIDSGGRIGGGYSVGSVGFERTGGIADSGGTLSSICEVATSLNDVKFVSNNLSVFPNPSSGIFTISFVGAQNFVPATIEIYNVLGEKVFSSNYSPSTNRYSLNLSSQPNGIYFYRVLNTDGSLMGEGKVVIER